MEKKTITIPYEEYASIEELGTADRLLLEAAIDAVKGSYAPYSHFNVGAAVRLADGTVVPGANQENAAYPSGLCAERTAMFAASAQHPGVPFESLAVVCSRDGVLMPNPGSPCGACRQVMAQYEREAKQPLRILLASGGPILAFTGVESLMPLVFNDL
jgi:cytidine deaminase